jgi:hypothetical protein
VLSGLKRRAGQAAVLAHAREDEDGIHVRMLDHRLGTGESDRGATRPVGRGPLLGVRVERRRHADATAQPLDRGAVRRPVDAAETEDSQTDGHQVKMMIRGRVANVADG